MTLQKRKERLLTLLNNLFAIKRITYGELSKVVPFEDKVEDLRELGQEFEELHLARFGTPQEGISTKSLISTITQVLTDGDTLAWKLESAVNSPEDAEDLRIVGVDWLRSIT